MRGGKLIYPRLSYQIVGILFDVYNTLGYGYPEKIYHKAISVKFDSILLKYKGEQPYKIRVEGQVIGRRYIDFIVDNRVILEIKQGKRFTRQHYHQVHQYLVITGYKLAILASFTPSGLRFSRVLNIKNN